MKKRSRKTVVRDGLVVGTRKLVRVGGNVMIALPKEFLEAHGLGPGDEIPFVANHILKIIPTPERDDEEDIKLARELRR